MTTSLAEQVRASEGIPATPERARRMLQEGGRLVVTLRSRRTGRHVTVRFTAKRRGPDRRWLSRATDAGRVGLAQADALFADEWDRPYPEGKLATFYLSTGEWNLRPGADPARLWAATHVLAWALGGADLERVAEVFVRDECARCGRPLTDPESVEKGLGPECAGRRTRSRQAERTGAGR